MKLSGPGAFIALVSLLIAGVVLGFVACSDCGQSAAGTRAGEALPWETIPLGIDQGTFRKVAASLSEADTDTPITCRDQLSVLVPDVGDREIVERSAGSHPVKVCLLKATAPDSSSPLLEIRGDFVDRRLARLTFRFFPGQYEPLAQELTARFGPGLETKFEEQTLSTGELENALLTETDLSATKDLKPPPKASERGDPVSLEDIGIGKLDLNEPLPEINLPDGGS
jgi:hypothetical protein